MDNTILMKTDKKMAIFERLLVLFHFSNFIHSITKWNLKNEPRPKIRGKIFELFFFFFFIKKHRSKQWPLKMNCQEKLSIRAPKYVFFLEIIKKKLSNLKWRIAQLTIVQNCLTRIKWHRNLLNSILEC